MQVHFRQPGARATMLAIGAAMVMAIAACGGGSSGNDTTDSAGGQSGQLALRIAYNPNATNTTIVVADQQGFFKKNGLDVKLTATQNSAALIPSIGKQFDLITVTPPSLLQAAAQGLKPILVAAEDVENSTDKRNSYVIGAKGVNSVADLKGKTIGVPSLSGNLYEGAVILLDKAGLKKTDVKFLQVPFADMAGGLKTGTIQAAVTIFPFNGQLLGQGGVDLGNPTDVSGNGGDALSAGWVATADWANSNKATIDAFNKAQDEALEWMKANDAAAKQILVKDFKLPDAVAQKFPITQWVSFEPKPEYLESWIEPMKKVGDLPAGFTTPASELVYQQS
ncbi:ABC transporter substrate-binding protein [Paractinoplanes globisporus]|uniref:ABC transporter substrate-binding protein n=1 Tax=Paractinoplanes globisporus TaxID=113565 RepID=A0ABW6W5Y0_9ACTN|nr:ABC transporter substrate-binding protein [Actinoplanes globisporus]